MQGISIERSDERQRYELTQDGELAGFAAFEEADGVVVFTHTIVLPAFEGRGFGSRLAAFALGDVVERGLRFVPRCPFIAAYVRSHTEFEASIARR
ncbi:GNAT family N-acetyltransferase [Agromyces sp. MMS24-JH15]|uniref:GNAT family N-acetyltransferase n=1 Tax=Agromyces sp. MMS24-JH15 TaxID=3243765 RepID=UPI003749E4BD